RVPQGVAEQRPKSTTSAGVVPLSEAAVVVIQTHLRQLKTERLAHGPGWQDSGRLFVASDGGELRPEWITNECNRLTLSALGRKVSPHGLRRTAAGVQEGTRLPLLAVRDRMRHAEIDTTVDYVMAGRIRQPEARDWELAEAVSSRLRPVDACPGSHHEELA